jgi:hypothetical protein
VQEGGIFWIHSPILIQNWKAMAIEHLFSQAILNRKFIRLEFTYTDFAVGFI